MPGISRRYIHDRLLVSVGRVANVISKMSLLIDLTEVNFTNGKSNAIANIA